MTCLIPNDWPVQITDEDPENGNEAEYELDGLKHLKVKERKDARLNVFVCFLINLIVQVLMSFVDIAVRDSDMLETLDIDTTEANRANNLYKSMTDLYAPLALALMSATSYKVTVAIGSLLISAAFVNISFLYNGPEGTVSWYWQIWLCGPAAVGVSCLRMGALIPILEYFKRDRVKALVITRVGTVIGAAATIGIMFAENLSWKILLRINAGVCVPCFAIAFILKDIVITEKLKSENEKKKEENGKKKEENEKKKKEENEENKEENEENKVENDDGNECCESNRCCQFIKNTFSIPVLKDRAFWVMVIVFFFFGFGTTLPTSSFPTLSEELQEQLSPPVDSFYEVLSANIGNLMGLILTYLLQSLSCVKSYRERKQKMGFVFSIISLAGYIMAILSIITSDDYIYYIVYIFVLTIFEVLTENFRDDSMPTAFGRFTIRLTQGFLRLSIGSAGVSAAGIQSGIEDGSKFKFRLGGGFFLFSGSISVLVLICNLISRRKSTEQKSENKSESECCSIFCCSNSSADNNQEEEKCCSFLCCNSCESDKEEENERTPCFTCLLPSCCKKKQSRSQSVSGCCSTFCCSNSSADNNQQEEICCSFLCCNSCESDKEEATERTACFTCLFPSCCKKKQSRSQSESDKNAPTPGTNCCNLISSSTCFRKKKPTSQSLPEIDKSESAKGTNCCKGFSLPCFQTKRPTSEPKLENNKNKDDIKINCCKTFPISCFETQSETNKGETDTSVKCFEGFSLSCSNRKRQSSHSEIKTNKSESNTDIKCCKGFPPSCFQKKQHELEYDSNDDDDDDVKRSDSNVTLEQDKSSCKGSILQNFQPLQCFSRNKSRPEEISSDDNTLVGGSNVKSESEILPDLQPPKQSDNESKQFSHGGSGSSSLAENIQNTINSEVSVKQQLVNIFSCKCLSTANRVSPTSSQGLIIHPDQYKRQENFSGSSVGSDKDLNSPISDIEKKLNKDNKQIATSTEEVSKNKRDSVEIPPIGNKNDLENFTGSSGGSDKDLESPFSEKGKKPNKDNKIIAPSTEKVPKDKRDTVEDDDKDNPFTPGPVNIPDSTGDQSKHSQPKNQPKSDGTPDPKIYPSLKRLENGEKDKRNKGEKKRKYTIESSEDSEEEFLNCPKLEKALAPPLKSSRKKRLKYELKRIKTAKKRETDMANLNHVNNSH